MPFDVCMLFSLALAALGFLSAFVIAARNGGLAFGWKSWANMGAFFRDPTKKGQKRVFALGLLLTVFGGCGAMTTTMIRDAKSREACTKICEEQGYSEGIVRGDPHAERPNQTPRMCWCKSGEEWSDEPGGPPPTVD